MNTGCVGGRGGSVGWLLWDGVSMLSGAGPWIPDFKLEVKAFWI